MVVLGDYAASIPSELVQHPRSPDTSRSRDESPVRQVPDRVTTAALPITTRLRKMARKSTRPCSLPSNTRSPPLSAASKQMG